MKIGNILLVVMTLGLVLIVLGMNPYSSGIYLDERLGSGETTGMMYAFSGDAYYTLEVNDPNKSISFYVLDIRDTLSFIEHHNISSTNPVFSLRNVSKDEGLIHLDIPGVYSFVVMNPTNTSVGYYLLIDRLYPQAGLFTFGVVLFAFGGGGMCLLKVAPRTRNWSS